MTDEKPKKNCKCVHCGQYSPRKFEPAKEDSELRTIRLCNSCTIESENMYGREMITWNGTYRHKNRWHLNQCVKSNLVKSMRKVLRVAKCSLKRFGCSGPDLKWFQMNNFQDIDDMDIRLRYCNLFVWCYLEDMESWFAEVKKRFLSSRLLWKLKVCCYLNPPLTYRNRPQVKKLRGKKFKYNSLKKKTSLPGIPKDIIKHIFSYLPMSIPQEAYEITISDKPMQLICYTELHGNLKYLKKVILANLI